MRSFVRVLSSVAGGVVLSAPTQPARTWNDTFAVEKSDLRTTGRNDWFVLVPGYTLELEKGDERVVKRVLDATRVVDGVLTRVVEERETKAGALVEISRNYFAISATTKDVYYFGEEVDLYTRGKITGHSGAWLSGVSGARFGLYVPARPRVGAGYYQEVAPGVAMDRARTLSTTQTFVSPAGRFVNCLKIEETTPLEPGVRDVKVYAPGVGQVADGELVLVKYGMREPGTGEDLVRDMHARWAGKRPATLTFVQTTQFPDGRRELWYESYAAPNKLRIDIAPLDSMRAIVFNNDSIQQWRAGRLVSARPFVHPLLVLSYSLYAQPPEPTLVTLRGLGFDLTRLRQDRWNNRPVWVVGGGGIGDSTSNQFWIDQERLYIVRLIQAPPRENLPPSETRWLAYDKFGESWVETDVQALRGGSEVQRELYNDVKTNVPLDDAIFRASAWKRPAWIDAARK